MKKNKKSNETLNSKGRKKNRRHLFPNGIQALFLFWIYNLLEPFLGTCLLCVCSLLGSFIQSSENSLCERKTKVCFVRFSLIFWAIWWAANRIGEELCSPRTISVARSLAHSIEFLWTFQSDAMRKTYFKCQLSTVNIGCVFLSLSVCFIGLHIFCLYVLSSKNVVTSLSVYRFHFGWKRI